MKKGNKFDIRHKETLTLFLREYFELFFPDLAQKIDFKSSQFLDKELTALFDRTDNQDKEISDKDQSKITDALILLKIMINGDYQWILIHWEQQSQKRKDFEQRMFHYFCGIYFKFKMLVFPIAMFTDSAKWRKPVKDRFSLSLLEYSINDFTYRLIKLKNIPAEEFEKKIDENPLAAAYLPLTDYPKHERPIIKAKALNGAAKVPQGPKMAVLVSLIDQSLRLDPEEDKQFKELIQDNPMFKEAKMLQSVEEVFIEKGKDIGRKETMEETAIKLFRSGWLNKKQIGEITRLDKEKLDELERSLKKG
ncbi:Uncharacterized protein dnl_39110 [Desulfonema limicola]|uniref:Transposase (putative) YhgA-like domain-containing protein n=1 Tax=Desulfonema limicola TaxID=45656 RepID=A0A975BA37_9BACT|nr:hypothetical protein [Desulfonema limicola]QTA81573.1 Uncharacterized protein dnl_39110 [Desulfonema limicola]